jgi:hypothetical protein
VSAAPHPSEIDDHPETAEHPSVRRSVADAFKVSYAAGEIVVDFGRVRDDGSEGGMTIDLANRVAMTPEAAKRLISSLIATLRLVPPEQQASAAAASPSAPATSAMSQLIASLGVPHRHERSFRLSDGTLFTDRHLLSVDKRHFGADPAAKIVDLCANLGLPAALLARVPQHVGSASCIHWGFETDPGAVLHKVYFEFHAGGAREPTLLHVAYKWSPSNPQSCVETRYVLHPALSADGIRGRLAQLYGGARESCDVVCDVLELAARRAPAEKLQYLEVREDDNGRRSFDLNLYNAQLQVRDLHPLLSRMRQRCSVRPGQFQALYDQIKIKTAGHLAGGVHRNGKEFFNFYYGVEKHGV